MRDTCIAISSIRNSTAAGFYDKCSAVRALRVYLRSRLSFATYWEWQYNLATTQMSLPQRYGVFSVGNWKKKLREISELINVILNATRVFLAEKGVKWFKTLTV